MQERPFCDTQLLAQLTVGGLAIALATSVGIAAVDFARLAGVAPGQGSLLEGSTASALLLQFVQYLLAGPFFLAWFYRSYSNLPSLGAPDVRNKQRWAILAWFIPIAELAWPKQLANDVWKTSDPSGHPIQEEYWKVGELPPFLNWWWGLYIAGPILNRITDIFVYDSGPPASAGEYAASEVLGGIAALTTAAAALIAIQVVREISARQRQRASALSLQPA